MEQKKRLGFWRVVGAIALGYLAGGVTFILLKVILWYPADMLFYDMRSADLAKGIGVASGLGGGGVWILVSIFCIQKWGRKVV
jgi:hypothetical protein